MTYDPPLSGVTILDLSDGPMTALGRLLADLGAAVTVVTLNGVTQRRPADLATAINRHGLSTAVVDAAGWADLLSGADILIENTQPGSAAETALAVHELRAAYPGLVILSVSDFGRDNRFSRWQATTPVLHALTSELSRSGVPGRKPVVPPGTELPYHAAAAQAAVLVTSALWDRLHTGAGDLIDFSILDGAMQTLDPPFGSAGSAAAGVPIVEQRRDWDAERQRYPIVACADGHVRICFLSRRQWRGMFEWMGSPQEFADPRFAGMRERFASPTLLPAVARFCADKTRAELEREGQRHGVPTAAVLPLADALRTRQVVDRGFFREVELTPGVRVPVPVGVVEIDGIRASTLNIQSHTTSRLTSGTRPGSRLPLTGLRVLDLGVIVVGSDTARLFGDLGADVVKIENSAYPDGLRGNLASITQGFGAGHRNKRSIGIDLRTAEGRALAHRLVADSDVVLTNFKPGVAETLGMDHATLRTVNPRIVVVESSAFGPTGPWARRLGYGPLVRAAAGFTDQWVDDPETFCDTVTVYPDHVCARIGALAALSLLLRRTRTGAGGAADVAQTEVMLSHLAAEIAGDTTLPDAPWDLFPAADEDRWVAATVRSDADWLALCAVIDRADLASDSDLATRTGRQRHRARIDAAVSAWTTRHPAAEAMNLLQASGVPAGAVLHAAELPEWEYCLARRAFRTEHHPHGRAPFMMENVQIHSDRVADPPLRNAPLLGEQTREIAAELLHLTDAAIDDLLARGVLEEPRS